MSRDLTPREIVHELDRYIVGQKDAKRAVAVAIRNRFRRRSLPPEMRDEILPKNIIMIGATGVGKTEIARRLSGLVGAPFVKVEASKYTEVGYVGRDVEGMVRDLVENGVALVKAEKFAEVQERAREAAEERLLDLLLPLEAASEPEGEERRRRTRSQMRALLREGKFEEREVEVSVAQRATPAVEIFSNQGIEHMGFDFQNLFEQFRGKKKVKRRLPLAEARSLLEGEEAEKLVDHDKVKEEALRRTEQDGIIFLDELDKIAGREAGGRGPDVSREGVQRDLLPVVEGTTVQTRHGAVKTDHILFIAAGAFHVAKPADLIPELQGRFPIRVELQPLGRAEFLRILKEPKNALTKQYEALLGVDGVTLEWTAEGLAALADFAEQVNERTQNIGARRLHTLLERLLEDLLFEAPDCRGKEVRIDEAFVRSRVADVAADEDLSRYIL